MYASNLARHLYNAMQRSDVGHPAWSDLEARMESLRGCGRIPRGRENHGVLLTDEEIANVIFGLASDKPGWAGNASICLAKLRPVGGMAASFKDTATLSQAVQLFLSNKSARKELIKLTLSTAEIGTNCNGSGQIIYRKGEELRIANFVSEMAVSLMQPGSEKDFDSHYLDAPIGQQLVFNSRFFEKLSQDAELCRRLKRGPISDGKEYDGEDAEKLRRERLGVTPASRYYNVGVDNQVTWPREETLVRFDKYTMVLMPKTKDKVQSISIDLIANKLSMREARTVINRFLSIMTWCCDQFAVAQDGWSGNPVPVAVSRRDLAFSTAHVWVFDRNIPKDKDVLRALALYREARNAEQNYLISYAVLNYCKVLELRNPGNNGVRNWIKDNYAKVIPKIREDIVKLFDEARGAQTPQKYIHEAYRVAMAHSNTNVISDPDCSVEQTRLHVGAEVLHDLARYFITNELKVSDCMFSGS